MICNFMEKAWTIFAPSMKIRNDSKRKNHCLSPGSSFSFKIIAIGTQDLLKEQGYAHFYSMQDNKKGLDKLGDCKENF